MSNTSGNWRFDMVTFTAVPSPAGVAALGLAGVLAGRRRRA
jgi:MYXO-CTERM domain-containing protein